jgi:hypothetical protein
MNITIMNAQMKWIERADCRPPNKSSNQGTAAFIQGDIVNPDRINEGTTTPVIMR